MAKKSISPSSTNSATLTNSPSINEQKPTQPPSVNSLPTSQNATFSYQQQLKQYPKQKTIHRCRFTDFTPATITAIACSPPTWNSTNHLPANSDRAILAVGRGNGDIELWIWLNEQQQLQPQYLKPNSKKKVSSNSPPQAWTLYRTLPGHLPAKPTNTNPSSSPSTSKVEHLLFTHQLIPSDTDTPLDQDQIDSMARTPPRLLGTNGADELIEWEWDGPRAGTIKRTLSMPPSVAIWSLSVSPGSTRLAIGCDDGTIRIANIADNQLELIRKLDPCKTRLLSLAWGILPPKNDSSSDQNSTHPYPIEPPDSQLFLVAGCADSSLRKWAVGSGRCVSRMTVEKLQGEHTLVWTVAVVNDTIISGDSVGNVHFWDSNSCSRRQTIRAHRADILCIALSPDGQSVFTSGVDQKTCQLTLNIQSHKKTGAISQSRWLLSASRRLHSHDVRALAISPPYNPLFNPATSSPSIKFTSQNLTEIVPVLISGGLDMSLVLCPAGPPVSSMATSKVNLNHLPNPISDSYSVSFADSMQRKISYATQREPVASLSPHAHLLVCRNSKKVSIWRLRSLDDHHDDPNHESFRKKKSANQLADDAEAAWTKVVEMDLKCRTNLITSAISPDGRWLAVSDLYEVKIFYLSKVEDVIQPRRIKGFEAFSSGSKAGGSNKQGARSIEFSTDSTRLVFAGSLTSDLVVIELGSLEGTPQIKILTVFLHQTSRLVDQADPHRPVITPLSLQSDHHLNVSSYVLKIAISPDGQWLAVADSKKTLHIYNLDALKHHCYLTMPEPIVNCMAFPAMMPSVIVVGFATNELYVVDVESRQVPGWALELNRRASIEGLGAIREAMIGIEFAPIDPVSEMMITTHQTSASEHSNTAIVEPITNLPSIEAIIWGANWIAKVHLPLDSRDRSPLSSLLNPSSLGVHKPIPKRTRTSSSHRLSLDLIPDPNRSELSPSSTPFNPHPSSSLSISKKFQALLKVGFLNHSRSLVIVEKPFFDLLLSSSSSNDQHHHSAHLPPVWHRTGAYGT